MGTSSEQERHKSEMNLNMLMEEYKFIEEIGEKYFSYMYSCINYTFLFYGAALTLFQSLLRENSDSLLTVTVFLYLLPVFTYVLGLLYAYNSVAISKQGFFMIRIENDIIELNRRLRFGKYLHGWNILAKKCPVDSFCPMAQCLSFISLCP